MPDIPAAPQHDTSPPRVIAFVLSTGFSSVAHFTRGFAARFGEPPARRRRKIRGG
ncbi:AraC family transcriptional regulator [Paenirhodobacter populi]|uniref:AraC family transcriptional regulator n=1 Tax=Paenirhodobacter populi TaxID=2306993 RepID=UPI000FE2F52D|nr:AraC family transcriptional regulator [Sinirhodobacter populi]RWR08756.1 AraC family transcriptional regulator [Sinirhodobacter populi]